MAEATDPVTEPPAAADKTAADKAGDQANGAKPAAKGKITAEPTMHVRIASPFKVFFDDEAFSLSGENATGPFDILPHHHNFISLLRESELAVRTRAGTTKVRISGGIMHVKADQVIVFLNV